jgi:hypothetical protein
MSVSPSRLSRLRATINTAATIVDIDETEHNKVALFCRHAGATVSDASHTYALRCCGVSVSSTSGQIRLSRWLEKARQELVRIEGCASRSPSSGAARHLLPPLGGEEKSAAACPPATPSQRSGEGQ